MSHCALLCSLPARVGEGRLWPSALPQLTRPPVPKPHTQVGAGAARGQDAGWEKGGGLGSAVSSCLPEGCFAGGPRLGGHLQMHSISLYLPTALRCRRLSPFMSHGGVGLSAEAHAALSVTLRGLARARSGAGTSPGMTVSRVLLVSAGLPVQRSPRPATSCCPARWQMEAGGRTSSPVSSGATCRAPAPRSTTHAGP